MACSHKKLNIISWDTISLCVESNKIPRSWRKVHVNDLQKSGKDANESSNNHPVSFFFFLDSFKMFKRIILINRMMILIQSWFYNKRAIVRGEVMHWTSEIFNTIYWQFRIKTVVTGIVFVDLIVAYDTISSTIFIKKIYCMIMDFNQVHILSQCCWRSKGFMRL